MSEFNFKPELDYAGLLKQANAMALLVRAMEKTKTFQDIKIGELCREFTLQGYEEINAQRETNNKLTDEIEKLEQRLAEAEAKLPRWIPVGERLPEHNQLVAILTEYEQLCGEFYLDRFVVRDFTGVCFDASCVTHWMPLPEKPESGKGGVMKYKLAYVKTVEEVVMDNKSGILLSTAEVTGLLNSLEQRLAAAEAKLPKWIPVSDRLPKECEAVLICVDDNKVSYGYHFNGDWYAENIPLEAYDNIVTLWMPLPEAPKQDGDTALTIANEGVMSVCDAVADKIIRGEK